MKLIDVDALKAVYGMGDDCKDCKHHHYSECDIPYCDRIDYGYGWMDDDFCSKGERKEGEQDG